MRAADANICPGEPVVFTIDGARVEARRGQTLAAALYASGRRTFRATRVNGKPRGLYCGMGVCFDCIVKVDGRTVRACVQVVEDGMVVTLPAQFARGHSSP
jgi:predicted molibdopterin-dependent oxidoreductase YjgC